MNRSQPRHRSRSASPRREDRQSDRNYDRGARRDDVRDGKRTREDEPFEKDRRSEVKSRSEKVVGGIRYKGDSKPREKGERKRDESRRKDRHDDNDDDDRQGAIENKRGEEEKRKEKKEKKRRFEQPAEVMIKVTVNDRLGTKAQIPCYGSDNIGLFKKQVAARIGRPSEMIMLKRQGERPFKDHLTLEDYGVSDGVQLDLELDTGD